jgi:hypothetical protein
LARSDRREIRNRLAIISEHLLKRAYQPGRRSSSSRGSVVKARDQIAKLVQDSPSLRDYPAARLAEAYPSDRRKTGAETGLVGLSELRPWTADQVLDHAFWPPHEEPQE